MKQKFLKIDEIILNDCEKPWTDIDNLKGKPPGLYILRFTGEKLKDNTDCLVNFSGYYTSYVASATEPTFESSLIEIDMAPPLISEKFFLKTIAAATGNIQIGLND